jgi:hypothetical protein
MEAAMTGLSRESMGLIAAARPHYHVNASDQARIRRKLMQRIGLGAVAGSLVTAGTASARAAQTSLHLTSQLSLWAWAPTAAKVLGMLVLAGATTVGGVALWRGQNSVSITTETAQAGLAVQGASSAAVGPESVVLAASEVPPVDEAEPESFADPGQSAARRRASARTPALVGLPQGTRQHDGARKSSLPAAGTDRRLMLQANAIRASRAALQRGDAPGSLEALDRAIPLGTGGELEQEALYVRVNASCLQGKVGQARRYARTFLARFSSSPLAAKIRSSCAFSAQSGTQDEP